MAYDEKLAARIRSALRSRRGVVEKHMFGGVAFMVRGHMSCGVVGPNLMVRVDPAEAEGLLREPYVRPMDFTGRPMRGFLFVDSPGVATAASLRRWLGKAIAHAETKPAKSRKKAGTRRGSRSARA
jgi:TfoX/Sxy family transcriptional regulator of competence genes